MTSKEFVIWLKGFSEACNDLTATPKQWDRIKEVLDEVEDDLGIDIEIDDYKPGTNLFPPNGTAPGWLRSASTGVLNTGSSNTSITNFPSGTSITYTNKQQLND